VEFAIKKLYGLVEFSHCGLKTIYRTVLNVDGMIKGVSREVDDARDRNVFDRLVIND